MNQHRMGLVATAIFIWSLTPGHAWAACDLGIATLKAPESLNGCPTKLTGDDERQLRSVIQEAVNGNNATALQNIRVYVRELHDAYKAGPPGYTSSAVLAPVRVTLESLVGENERIALTESFTIADADDLFIKLIARAKADHPASVLKRIERLERYVVYLHDLLDQKVDDVELLHSPLLPVFLLMVAGFLLLGNRSYLFGRRLDLYKNAAEDWRSQEEQRSQKLGDALAKRWENEIGPLKKSLDDLAARLGGLEERVSVIAEKQATVAVSAHQGDEPSAANAPAIAPDSIDSVVQLEGLKESVASLLSWQKHSEKDDVLSLTGLIKVERKLLLAAWQKFAKAHGELTGLAQEFSRSEWKALQEKLLVDIPRTVQPDEELRISFESAVASFRDHDQVMRKFALIPGLANEPLETASSDDSTVLLRIRESAHLLSTIQSSSLMSDRLRFRLDKWVSERFVGFADLLFQKFQQAQLSEDRGESLAGCVSIARELLEKADLALVDIVLGETAFDSSQHVGRSTSSNPRLKNGVISGVIRNGFVRKSTGQVVRQPEVIVNRV